MHHEWSYKAPAVNIYSVCVSLYILPTNQRQMRPLCKSHNKLMITAMSHGIYQVAHATRNIQSAHLVPSTYYFNYGLVYVFKAADQELCCVHGVFLLHIVQIYKVILPLSLQ